MVAILMMSAKLVTQVLFKTQVFRNKGHDVIIFSMTSSTQVFYVAQIIL